jgi:hypothetical protein
MTTPREKIAIWPTSRASRISAKVVETLAGNRTISYTEIETYNAFAFDPGGAGRNVVLPAEAACKGVVVMISNKADAAEVLTIQNDAAGTIVTPTQNEAALIWCDGTNWYGLVGAQA